MHQIRLQPLPFPRGRIGSRHAPLLSSRPRHGVPERAVAEPEGAVVSDLPEGFAMLPLRRWVLAACAVLPLASPAFAVTQVWNQPPASTGAVVLSSWTDPEGSDSDMYAYESFTLASTTTITEVHWRGGYQYGTGYGMASNFLISFYESIAGGSQPHCGNPQFPESDIDLLHAYTGGNAHETYVGTFGGVPTYDYWFALPTAFVATGGVKWWIKIEASVPSLPYWGVSTATGGDGSHFNFSTGAARFYFSSGDEAISLYTSGAPVKTIAASASPAGSGTITGAGPYGQGSSCSLTATANPGFLFQNWTENGSQVSTANPYTFTVQNDRTLVAHFLAAYTVTTAADPYFGGTVSAGATVVAGQPVTVTATPATGFDFGGWLWYGTPMSDQLSYTFVPDQDYDLTAWFVPNARSAVFDFDTAWPSLYQGQSIPFDQTVGPITLSVSSPQGAAFSTQSQNSTFWNLPLFSGLYLYDNNLNRNTLAFDFNVMCEHVSLTFATADLQQNEVPTNMQLTAFAQSAQVGQTTAHATYGATTFPMGTITFDSPGAPFDRVELVLPYQVNGCTDFFVDNVVVTASPVSAAGDPAAAHAPRLDAIRAHGATRFAFTLPRAGDVRFALYDLAGRRVRELAAGPMTAGDHAIRWDGRDAHGLLAARGAYIARLEANGTQLTRNFTVTR